jgi:hypothetical protein
MTNRITNVAVTVAAMAWLLLTPGAGMAQCCGDCDGNGHVTVDELVTSVNRLLDGCQDDGICSGGHRFPASGQATSYGPGSDGTVQAGAGLSYTDNGDGTITDNNTGLIWEKKDDSGGPHGKDHSYTWGMTDAPYTMNGTMVTEFLAQLNNRCAGDSTTDCTAGGDTACVGIGNGKCGFAGHQDWRIPNVRELQSIVHYEFSFPTVSAAFHNAAGCPGCMDVTLVSCSCTSSPYYHSSTTYGPSPDLAWAVGFGGGHVNPGIKSDEHAVRAVRGGL